MPCVPATSFVTILDGISLLPQLRCMRDRLSVVGSACPLLVIAHGSAALTGGPMEALQALVGQSNVMRSSQLLNHSARTATVPMGRRLYTDARRYFLGTMIVKLHLWSLTRYKRLGFLDLDVVIVNNLDSLLALPVSYGSIAAVPAKACKRMNVFNGGVLVFAPHREVLRAMLLRACVYFWKATHARASVVNVFGSSCNAYSLGPVRGHHITLQKACEKRVTDQSILNYQFRKWYALDAEYNVMPRDFGVGNTSVLHFAGEPKPWRRTWSMTFPNSSTQRAGQQWQKTCRQFWNVRSTRAMNT